METSDYDFRKLRRQLGLTQEKMAKRLRISRPYYVDLEAGRKKPSEALAELARLVEMEFESKIDSKTSEPKSNYGVRSTASAPRKSVIADPKKYPNDAHAAGVFEDVEEHFEQLREIMRNEPEKAHIIRWLVRKHLKIEDLVED